MPHYLTTTDHCLFVWHNNQQTSNNFAVIRAVQKNRTTPGVPCNWNPQDEAGRGAKEKILASRNRMGLFISLFTFTNCNCPNFKRGLQFAYNESTVIYNTNNHHPAFT